MSAALSPGRLALKQGQGVTLRQWSERVTVGGVAFDAVVNGQPFTPPGEKATRPGAPNFLPRDVSEIDVEISVAVANDLNATSIFRDGGGAVHRSHMCLREALYWRFYCTVSQ